MKRYEYIFACILLTVPAGIVLFLNGYLGSFTRLLADDYCSAYYARRLGLLRSIWYWRLNWSGRYTAFGADWLMEKIGAYALPVIPPLSIVIWLVLLVTALHLALKYVFPDGKSQLTSVTLGTLVLFVVLLLSPNIPQSIYWWNGMRSYGLPLILLSMYAVLFQMGVEKLKSKKEVMAGSLFSFLLIFVNGGLSETYAAFQLALLGFLLLIEWSIRRDTTTSQFRFLLAGLLGAIVALVVVISAPGNAIRQGFFPQQPDIVTLFQISFKSYLGFVLQMIETSEKIAGLLGALLAAIWLGSQSVQQPTEHHWLALLSFFGAFILSFACFVPGVYGTSEPPPTRTIIIPVFILVACLLFVSFMLGQWTASHMVFRPPFRSGLLLIAVLLIGYSAFVNSQSLYEGRPAYIEFARKWDQTNALILKASAANLDSVQIPAMDNWAGLERPTPKKEYWPNVCYSLYYGIQVFGPRYSE